MNNFSDYLLNSIEKRDVKAIRGALNGYIDSDPAFKTTRFDEAVGYVQSKGIQVFEKMDDELPIPDGPYSESLFYEIRAGLQSNYSKERVEALKKIGKSCMQNAKVYNDIGAAAGQRTSRINDSNGGDFPKKAEHQRQKRLMPIGIMALVLLLIVIIIIIVMSKK